MSNKKLIRFLSTILFFVLVAPSTAQKLEPKKRVIEPDTTIRSKIMGKDYQLYISFPNSYSTKDSIKYPVLYVLDGRNVFPLFNSAREVMDFGKELEPVIIVGIGSGLDMASWFINRTFDYTTSKDTAAEHDEERQFGFPSGVIQSGGAEKFLQCLKKEIIPFIESHYKTTNDRGISGHSLGGLFAAYCLLNTRGVFKRFSISSPSFWWNKNEMIKQEEALFSKNVTWDIPSTKVFLCVGKKEDSTMVSDMIKFRNILEAKAYKNISVSSSLFDNETHLSALPVSLTRTLSVLYGK